MRQISSSATTCRLFRDFPEVEFTAWLCAFVDARLSPYSKLLLASPAQALILVAEEKAALEAQLSRSEDASDCFTQSALCLLQVAAAPRPLSSRAVPLSSGRDATFLPAV